MSYKLFVDEEKNFMLKKFLFQRWFYAFVGVLTMIPIILLTIEEIQNLKRENHDFAFCLLLLVHSSCVIFSLISTALFCRLIDALLTTITILLLSTYIGIHFYIRFLFNEKDLTIITVRSGFVLILLILLVPWANIMVYSYQIKFEKETICSRAITFSWFLNLDTILIISLLTLNIRSKADLNHQQLVILSIGLSLISLWLIVGKILAKKKSHHWIFLISFYLLSFIHIVYIAYTTYWTKMEYDLLSKRNENNLLPLLIITLICGSTNILVHILTILGSFSLFCCI